MTKQSQLQKMTEREQQSHLILDGTTAFLNRSYLPVLGSFSPLEVKGGTKTNNFRIFHFQKIVYDVEEDVYEKLVTVLTTIHTLKGKTFLLLKSDGSTIHFYIGIVADDSKGVATGLEESIRGIFPGTQLQGLDRNAINSTLQETFQSEQFIASVSGLPSLKVEDHYIQGLEKFIESMHGREFTTILIADPVYSDQLTVMRQGYEEIATMLSPFEKVTTTLSESEAHGTTETLTNTIGQTLSESLSKTSTTTKSDSHGKSQKKMSGAGIAAGGLGVAAGAAVLGPVGALVAGSAVGIAMSLAPTETSNTSTSQAEGETTGSTNSKNTSRSEAKGRSQTMTTGKSMQVENTNYKVKSILNKVQQQLERIDMSENYGMWNFAAYFLSEDAETAQVAASTYQSLIRGETSYLENSAINVWYPRDPHYLNVQRALAQFEHPQFSIGPDLAPIDAGTLIHTRELSVAFGLPRKSITGLPVMEMAEFGRDVRKHDSDSHQRAKIKLGTIYHMGQVEREPIELDVESLSMHTFITGTTGTGKSNTVYHMLHELKEQGIRFLVIEPAKGEYRHVFGGYEDVSVYGTNEKITPLLKINPFYFPEQIHVLEHIDQLIEIFNASWPMYAAMPAVLKEAVERVYIQAGWNLQHSYHYEQTPRYPSLHELIEMLKVVIDQSDYSQEVKSNYTGSLVTRVQSLRNGIAGKILVSDEIAPETLFESNCIIDLSRVGSMETKSLLMGLLFMRLKEHRIATATETNTSLKHVTVLEEAHHLLKRVTPTGEGNQLQAQSVEMISNSMAEMRTYGEGFIIADQSPNLLDLSAIRNTNTKIIMRLPEGQDRQDVGQAAALNPFQIDEIPKLEKGIAVIYQNDWLQPVLGKIAHFTDERPFSYTYSVKEELKEKRARQTAVLRSLFDSKSPKLIDYIEQSFLTRRLKLWYAAGNYEDTELKNEFVSQFLNGSHILTYAKQAPSPDEYHARLEQILRYEMDTKDRKLTYQVINALLRNMDESFAEHWREQNYIEGMEGVK
ncbi:ATP-binding protein [Savagea faecisuis]|uniref:Helicase HerA domain-containing protein n=1 Tax=Savagea faecisuis TaxID=1274803 RepID=A0ABW3H0V1_9BACL